MFNQTIYFLLCTLIASLSAGQYTFAQSSKKLIHDGNKLYEQKKYTDAEAKYKKSINTKDNAFIGNYNLGNTYYQEGKLDEAKQQFEIASGVKGASPEQLSKNYHNLGNTQLKNKKYEESIESYKHALKLNPKDNDTRYNLAYAQSMLQQQQQQQNKDNKDNKDKDKDKQDKKDQQKQDQDKKDEQKDQQQKQDQQKQDQAKEEQKKQEQAKKDKISKEDAEKILQALNNDEKKTQKKLNIKQPTKVSIEKQW